MRSPALRALPAVALLRCPFCVALRTRSPFTRTRCYTLPLRSRSDVARLRFVRVTRFVAFDYYRAGYFACVWTPHTFTLHCDFVRYVYPLLPTFAGLHVHAFVTCHTLPRSCGPLRVYVHIRWLRCHPTRCSFYILPLLRSRVRLYAFCAFCRWFGLRCVPGSEFAFLVAALRSFDFAVAIGLGWSQMDGALGCCTAILSFALPRSFCAQFAHLLPVAARGFGAVYALPDSCVAGCHTTHVATPPACRVAVCCCRITVPHLPLPACVGVTVGSCAFLIYAFTFVPFTATLLRTFCTRFCDILRFVYALIVALFTLPLRGRCCTHTHVTLRLRWVRYAFTHGYSDFAHVTRNVLHWRAGA